MKTNNDIRADFEILADNKFAYLDSGATSQHPRQVLDAVRDFYAHHNANPYRGSYSLSVTATQMYNDARHKVAKLINTKHDEEILFTKNATESLNLVAYSYGLENLKQGDKIVLSIMEHHSMIVPWQMVAQKTGATLDYIYLNNDFCLDRSQIDAKITPDTKVVGISSVSNVLGTINDVEYVIKRAHSVGAVVVVDISQSIAHLPFDVQKTDADFVAFSGHKMFGPMGVGVLYGKKELLDKMPPFLLGGDMIEYVYEQNATFAELPNKFEAGTQNAGGVVGLGSAVDYILDLGYDRIKEIEEDLCNYAYQKLSQLKYIDLYCTKDATKHSGVFSFNVHNVHSHDVASILDAHNVYIRSGNHCTQPLLRKLGLDSTCRASLSVYNTREDIDKLVDALEHVHKTFKKYIKE